MKKRNQRGDSQAKQRLALAVYAYLQPKAVHHHALRRGALAGGMILLAIILIWIAGNMYWMKFELEGTTLDALNSDSQLEKAVEDKARDYRLQILRPDGMHQGFSLQEMGMRVHNESSIAIARHKQQALSSRLQWWRPISFELAISADEKILQAFIAQHATISVEPARDASISIVDGAVQVTEAVTGKQYGLNNPMETILETAGNLQTSPLQLRVIAQRPTVTSQTLAETKQKLNNTINQSITFTVNGQEVKPSSKDIASWITLANDPQNKTVTINVNADAVRVYVNQLASSHNRPPKSQIALSSGGVIPGTTGVTVTNTNVAIDTVAQNLLNGKGLKIDLPVIRTPFKTITSPTAGKWIDVDLTNKRMFAYSGSTLVRSFLISAGAPATPTVTGTFAIYSKFATQTMSGPNADGSRYVQPDVPWVNYFYRDYAIHGNYWRPTSYFGNVNSSHGCIGLLTGDSSWLYSWAPIGTPVVVHY